MAQKNWQTVLADQLEGGVSTERALTDIKRGVQLNLIHESIGFSQSATPKYVSGIDVFTGTGVVAFDKIKYLGWKDYRLIAEGKDVIVPHVGSVDSNSNPSNVIFLYWIDEYWFNKDAKWGDLPSSDCRTKNSYLASTLDCELFDLLIAAGAGQKDGLIQVNFPLTSYFHQSTPFNYYKLVSDIGTELETTITPYIIGMNRKEINCIVEPKLWTELISHFKGNAILIERVLEFIQNEQIQPARISNITFIRHPFLNNKISKQVTNSFGSYDFSGVRMIFYFVGAPFIVPVFAELNGVINKDTGNYRMIHKVIYAKGVIYGNMIKVITDKSSPNNPLPFEKILVKDEKY